MARRECVCFLLVDKDFILLERRSSDVEGTNDLNIPGGHIEADETRVEALVREVEEELGVKPLSYTFVCSELFDQFEPQLLHYFVVKEWSGKVINNESQQLVWRPLEKVSLINEPDRVAVSCYLGS